MFAAACGAPSAERPNAITRQGKWPDVIAAQQLTVADASAFYYPETDPRHK